MRAYLSQQRDEPWPSDASEASFKLGDEELSVAAGSLVPGDVKHECVEV